MEGTPNLDRNDAPNKNEAPAIERELTPELLQESIERAIDLNEQLQQFDNQDGESVVSLNKEEWAEAGILSAELKEVLRFIPATECMQNGLPYHPTDEKFAYPTTPFPQTPDYPLGYNPQPSEDGAQVDGEQRGVVRQVA